MNVEEEAVMKRLLLAMAVTVLSVSFSTAVLSEEKTRGLPSDFGQFRNYQLKGQKDECLIVAKNCISENEAVMKRVDRLNREIGKGSAVYTPEELKILRDQLKWIYSESNITL
jgi:hypothetical protein